MPHLAAPTSKKFDDTKWFKGQLGSPIIEDSLAWFECKNYDQIRSGDHIILIGNVKYFRKEGGYPLGYYNGNYIKFNNEDLNCALALWSSSEVNWVASIFN